MIAHLGQAFSAAASDDGDKMNVCSGMSCGDCNEGADCDAVPGCDTTPLDDKCKVIKADAVVGKDPTCINQYGAPYVAEKKADDGTLECSSKFDIDCNPSQRKCVPKCDTNPLGCSSCPDDTCGSVNAFCYRPNTQEACDSNVTNVFDYSTADLGTDTTCVKKNDQGMYVATAAEKQKDGTYACPPNMIDCVKTAAPCQMLPVFDDNGVKTIKQRLSTMTSDEARAYVRSLAVVPCKQIKSILGITDDDTDDGICGTIKKYPVVIDGIGEAMADAIQDLDCALSACKTDKSIGQAVVAALPSDAPKCPSQNNAGPMVWGVCIGIIISVVAALIVRSHYHPSWTGRSASA